jgi:hypothetical protein
MRREIAGPRKGLPAIGEATSVVADSTVVPNTATAVDTVDALLLGRLDLLKIGSEVEAVDILEGASATLWRLRPMLFIAAANDVDVANLAARAKEFGYRCWRMETPLFNPDNFNRRDKDIFDAATALALVAIPEEVDVALALDGCVELTGAYGPNLVSTNLPIEAEQDTPPDSTRIVGKTKPGLMGKLRRLLR